MVVTAVEIKSLIKKFILFYFAVGNMFGTVDT
jgi:hypothetical protein